MPVNPYSTLTRRPAGPLGAAVNAYNQTMTPKNPLTGALLPRATAQAPTISMRPSPTAQVEETPATPQAPAISMRPNPVAQVEPTQDPGNTTPSSAPSNASSNNPAPNPNIPYNTLPATPQYENFNSAPVQNSVSSIAAPKYSTWQPTMQNPLTLQRQAPLTENGKLYESTNLDQLKTGKFGDVESARNEVSRANALRSTQAIQSTNGILNRSGEFDPEAALRARDKATAGADAANLDATNSVFKMQRAYGQDALSRANGIEADNQTRAVGERNYLTGVDNTNYSRGKDGRDYANWTADSLNQDAIAKGKYGDSRADLGNENARTDTAQHNENKDKTYLTDLNKANYGDSKAEALYGRQNDLWKTTTANTKDARDFADNRNRFDLTRGDANAATAWSEKNTEGQQADSRSRFDLTRGDTLDQTNYDRNTATRLETKGDALAAINGIADPKARAAAMQMYTSGTPIRDILAKIETNGTINSDYASASPGTAAYNAKIDELKQYYPKIVSESGLDNETDAEYNARIAKMAASERTQDRTLERAPANTATEQQAAAAAKNKLTLGQPLTKDETDTLVKSGDIPSYTIAQGDLVGSNAVPLLGKTVSVDGQILKLMKQGREEKQSGGHIDYSVVQTPTGETKYIYQGAIHDQPLGAAQLAAR